MDKGGERILGEMVKKNERSRLAAATSTVIAFMLFVSVYLSQPVMVNGEERVELSVTAGFGNEVKEGSWVPVRIKLTNNGAPLEGDVSVQFTDDLDYEEWTGTAEEHVELPRGGTKEVTLILPGDRLVGRQKVVFTVEGKKVAEARLGGDWTGSDTLSIGVLSTTADAGTFLSGLSGDVSLLTLKPEEIPEVGIALSGLDVLVVNNFPADTLSANQTEAIKRWVASGGTLIIGGGPEYNKAAQAFQELSPVEVTGTKKLDNIDALQQKQYGSDLSFKSPITISTANLKEKAKSIIAQGDIPIIASSTRQEGSVIYTAYNLTTAPLNDWPGNTYLWDSILSGSRTSVTQYSSLPWSLLQAVDYIPSLKLPSIGIISLAFLLYIVLIGPVLYFILRKLDRRGLAWAIIPSGAILLAMLIYAYGAGVRGNEVMIHQVNVLKLHTDGAAELRGATGVFVPDGGTYRLQLPPAIAGWPVENDYVTSSSASWKKYNTRITPEGTDITFKNVEFWSMRKAYVEGQVEVGPIVADLTVKGERLVGTVKNESQFDLTDVHLLTGGKKESLGTLKAGETEQIDMKQGNTSVQVSSNMPGQLRHPGSGDERENQILDYLEFESEQFQPFQSQVQLVGWTEQPVFESTVLNRKSQQYALSLVVAPLQVKAGKDGKIVWPKGAITPQVVSWDGSVDISTEDFSFSSGGGTITFRFDLSTEERVKLNKLQADFQGTADSIEWLNGKTGQWEAVDSESSSVSLDDFVLESGAVLLKISRDEGNDQFYPFPSLEAEGTVIK